MRLSLIFAANAGTTRPTFALILALGCLSGLAAAVDIAPAPADSLAASRGGAYAICSPGRCNLLNDGKNPPATAPPSNSPEDNPPDKKCKNPGIDLYNGKMEFPPLDYDIPSEFSDMLRAGLGFDEGSRGGCPGAFDASASNPEGGESDPEIEAGTANYCGDPKFMLPMGNGTYDAMRPWLARQREDSKFDYVILTTARGLHQSFRRYPFGYDTYSYYRDNSTDTPAAKMFVGVNGAKGVLITRPADTTTGSTQRVPIVEYYPGDGSTWTFFGFISLPATPPEAPPDETLMPVKAVDLAQGMLWKIEKPTLTGTTASVYVHNLTDPKSAIKNGFESPNIYTGAKTSRLKELQTSTGLRYAYTYAVQAPRRLTTAEIFKDEVLVKKIEYNYYDAQLTSPYLSWPIPSGSSAYVSEIAGRGGPGDLRYVKVTTYQSAGVPLIEYQYHRYYTYSEVTDDSLYVTARVYNVSPYYYPMCHTPKAKVGPEGIRRLIQDGIIQPDLSDIDTITEAVLVKYADNWFQPRPSFYEGSRFLSTTGCGCQGSSSPGWTKVTGSASGSFDWLATSFLFPSSPTWTDSSKLPYCPRITEQRPDGTFFSSLYNNAGELQGSIVSTTSPQSGSPGSDGWQAQFSDVDARGRTIAQFGATSVTSLNYDWTPNISTSTGKVTRFSYKTDYTGATTSSDSASGGRLAIQSTDFLPGTVTSVGISTSGSSTGTGAVNTVSSSVFDHGASGGTTAWESYTYLPPASADYWTGDRVKVALPRPVSARRVIDSSTSEQVSYSYVYWTTGGSDGEFQVKKVTRTETTPATQFGSGADNISLEYRDQSGRTILTRSATERWSYFGYDEHGQLTQQIEDVKRAYGSDAFPALYAAVTAFGISSTDFPLGGTHLVTETTYDAQGRIATRSLPTPADKDSRSQEFYYFTAPDGRMITLSIPLVTVHSGAKTYHGPASCRIDNLAGQTEAELEIALIAPSSAFAEGTTNVAPLDCSSPPCVPGWLELDAAANKNIVSMVVPSVGKVSRLSVNTYNTTSSQLLERRIYHTIPENPPSPAPAFASNWNSWLSQTAPTATPNEFADITKNEYDDAGRLARVTDPSGTMMQTVFDFRGLPVATYVGTSNSASVGDGRTAPSSTTSDMVKTIELHYVRGNGVSEGWLFRKIENPTGDWTSASDAQKRITAYQYDSRGRMLIEQTVNAAGSPVDKLPQIMFKYDNLDRVIARATYSSSASISVTTDITTTAASSGRQSFSETMYDAQGRVFKRIDHAINQSTGAVIADSTDAIVSTYRYDPEGRQIVSTGAALSKTRYDRLGRAVRHWTLGAVGGDPETYSDDYSPTVGTIVDHDYVLEMMQNVYEAETGNILVSASISRSQAEPNTPSSFGTMGDLNTDQTPDPASFSTATLKGRAQFSSFYYDDQNRLTTTAFYGTNGLADFRPNGGTPSGSFSRALDDITHRPASSTLDFLVTLQQYAADGAVDVMTDARGYKTKNTYDGAGRVLTTTRNWTSSSTYAADENQIVNYSYVQGLLATMTAKAPSQTGQTGGDQVTTYTYGTVVGSDSTWTSSYSTIATKNLLARVTYPNTTFVDKKYNALGEVTATRDQMLNVIRNTYDQGGRLLKKEATINVAANANDNSGTDDDVRDIQWEYDARGLLSTVTQHGASSVAKDQVAFSYDDHGALLEFRQKPTGALSSTTDGYAVVYTNKVTIPTTDQIGTSLPKLRGRTGVRRTAMTLPGADGTLSFSNASHVIKYNYGPSITTTVGTTTTTDLSWNDLIGRVERVDLSGNLDGSSDRIDYPVATYSYLGASRLVGTELSSETAHSNSVGGMTNRVFGTTPSATDTYAVTGLDRFNRVTESSWGRPITGGGDAYAYWVSPRYDYASNVASALDHLVPKQDVIYTNDRLDRLKQAQEGTANSGITAINSGTQSFNQVWSRLSHTGNWLEWSHVRGLGVSPDPLPTTEDREFNQLNQIHEVDSVTYTYNDAGQLTDDGDKIYTYDVFGRLRFVHKKCPSGCTGVKGKLLEENRYNGLGHRIAFRLDTDADHDVDGKNSGGTSNGSDPIIYQVFDERWCAVATFKNGDAVDQPRERFVYHNAGFDGVGGSSYIDDVILRERNNIKEWTSDWTPDVASALPDRLYYLQNWRHDVSVLFQNHMVAERVKYSSYGVPRARSLGDFNQDGFVEDADFSLFVPQYNLVAVSYTSHADAWGEYDLNVDGVVDDNDFVPFVAAYSDLYGVPVGTLSRDGVESGAWHFDVGNRIGYAGYQWGNQTAGYHVRHRFLAPTLGTWTAPDPADQLRQRNTYQYCAGIAVADVDPEGLWETEVHHQMAFWLVRPLLNTKQSCRCAVDYWYWLSKGSDYVDGAGEFISGGLLAAQSTEKAYQHGMRAPGEPISFAKDNFDRFIAEHLAKAKAAANLSKSYKCCDKVFITPDLVYGTETPESGPNGNMPTKCVLQARALFQLGQAFHAFSDSLSPAHTGFQVWYGIGGSPVGESPAGYLLRHHQKESMWVYETSKGTINGKLHAQFDSILKYITQSE